MQLICNGSFSFEWLIAFISGTRGQKGTEAIKILQFQGYRLSSQSARREFLEWKGWPI